MAHDIDPFFRALRPVLEEKIASAMSSLADGSAVQTQDEVVTTAEKYAAQTSYIKALNDVLRNCHEIEVQMYGGKKPDEEQG